MMPQGLRNRDAGFSLVELMVVVFIMSILVLIAVASFAFTTRTAARATCENNRRTFDTAIVLYRNDNDVAPDDIGDLAPYIANFDSSKICPRDTTTQLRYDPILERVVCDYHE